MPYALARLDAFAYVVGTGTNQNPGLALALAVKRGSTTSQAENKRVGKKREARETLVCVASVWEGKG